jgi:hypothetical protein
MVNKKPNKVLLEKYKKKWFTPQAFRREGLRIVKESKLPPGKKHAIRKILDSQIAEERHNVMWAVETAGLKGIISTEEAAQLMCEILRRNQEQQRKLQKKSFGKR